jgi:hypothetical protein
MDQADVAVLIGTPRAAMLTMDNEQLRQAENDAHIAYRHAQYLVDSFKPRITSGNRLNTARESIEEFDRLIRQRDIAKKFWEETFPPTSP